MNADAAVVEEIADALVALLDDGAMAHDGAIFRTVIDAIADPIFVKDEDHRWILLNQAFCTLIGHDREQMLGKSDYEFFPKEQADVFWQRDAQVFVSGEPDENEEEITDIKGRVHVISTKKRMFVDAAGNKMLVGVIRDITERRKLEARLKVAERLMSLGTLAAGIAHEINNPLAYLMANLEFVEHELERAATGDRAGAFDPEWLSAMRAARDGAERVRTIVGGLKTFSWTNEEELEAVDLGEVLRTAVRLVSNEIRHCAKLVEQFDAAPLVWANPNRLGQVFLNLLINATQSIVVNDTSQNEIRLVTGTTTDGRALIEVHDSGAGIAEENMSRIFDPFFTTKPVGVGTGLGLSICHNIVEAFGGHIEVDSVVGCGSVFRVVLPAALAHQTPAPMEAIDAGAAASVEARGRVMIIDDEPELLSGLSRLLSRSHDVVTLTSASAALARLLANTEHFDVVFCDLMMPEMTGMDLHIALAEQAPEYLDRLVFITGGAFAPHVRAFLEDIPNTQLLKPINTRLLRELVRERVAARE
ncbi:MAG: PAS domain S-box protein [Bradymonadaceae bacterium]|nr:PAS domain S-box protein [Lujinxingiaceae bacterium]